MGRVTSYVVDSEATSPRWCAAFAAGCGGLIQTNERLRPGDVALFGSPKLWPLFEKARSEGRRYYYGDHAYFGRGSFYRCTRNAMQHSGEGQSDGSRFRAFNIPVRDWRKSGDHILLCPNSETFLGLHGYRHGQWIEETTAELRKHTDRPIKLRWKVDATEVPLAEAMINCWAVVTFTSNSAVEAILAGIPAICTAPCAGLTMSTSDLSLIENLPMPEGRFEWASVLADNQWTINEMRRGDLWRAIGAQ